MIVFVQNDEARRRAIVAVGLVVAAWVALVVWGQSPYAMWMDHGHMGEHGAALPLRLVVFAVGWTLMVIAMMLPGTLPLLARAAGSTQVFLAWVAVWVGFGAFSYLVDNALHEVVEHAPALAGVIAPGLLLLAGIYQLTPLKRGFLARCRPEEMARVGFGHASTLERWLMGVRHGLNCVGSCWALMLLMLAFGGMNMLGMVLLGALMTIERLAPRGLALARVLGALLIVAAVVVVVVRVSA